MSRRSIHQMPIFLTKSTLSLKEAVAKVRRHMKRLAIADGHITDPAKLPPKWEWHWGISERGAPTAIGVGGIVRANTKGEARALIKRELGCKPKERLPHCIQIVRVKPNANPTRAIRPTSPVIHAGRGSRDDL